MVFSQFWPKFQVGFFGQILLPGGSVKTAKGNKNRSDYFKSHLKYFEIVQYTVYTEDTFWGNLGAGNGRKPS